MDIEGTCAFLNDIPVKKFARLEMAIVSRQKYEPDLELLKLKARLLDAAKLPKQFEVLAGECREMRK